MYATGKILSPNTGIDFRELDDVAKTFSSKNGKLIGRRGEDGHPHTGQFFPSFSRYENLTDSSKSPLGFS